MLITFQGNGKRKFSIKRNSSVSLNHIDTKVDTPKEASPNHHTDADETESQRQMKCTWPYWWYHENRAKKVDLISRVLFPVTYLLFNIGYWVAYGYFIT